MLLRKGKKVRVKKTKGKIYVYGEKAPQNKQITPKMQTTNTYQKRAELNLKKPSLFPESKVKELYEWGNYYSSVYLHVGSLKTNKNLSLQKKSSSQIQRADWWLPEAEGEQNGWRRTKDTSLQNWCKNGSSLPWLPAPLSLWPEPPFCFPMLLRGPEQLGRCGMPPATWRLYMQISPPSLLG